MITPYLRADLQAKCMVKDIPYDFVIRALETIAEERLKHPLDSLYDGRIIIAIICDYARKILPEVRSRIGDNDKLLPDGISAQISESEFTKQALADITVNEVTMVSHFAAFNHAEKIYLEANKRCGEAELINWIVFNFSDAIAQMQAEKRLRHN